MNIKGLKFFCSVLLETLVMLVAVPRAGANTITLLSGAGTYASGAYNSGFNGGAAHSPDVTITPVSAWATDPGGASWISFQNTGLGQPSSIPDGTYSIFTQAFNLPYSNNSGTISVWADDTTSISINGTQVYAAAPNALSSLAASCVVSPYIGCTQSEGLTNFTLNPSLLVQGANTITFDTMQLNGDGYGLLYDITLNSTNTPEPMSLLLLGSGLVGVGLKLRRRAFRR